MKKLYFALFACLIVSSLPANAASPVVISEFLASNPQTGNGLLDDFGERSDWIEIRNVSSSTVNLLNWCLTDDAGNLTKWRFPATNFNAGGFMVIFASGRDRRIPGATLHTSFQLSSSGEYLALVQPDGTTIATEFAPKYPAQVPNVSYGYGVATSNTTLVAMNAAVRVRIPSSGVDGTNWLNVGFDDSSWTAGTNGVGYGATNVVTAADYGASVLATAPVGYWRLNESSGATAANLGSGAGLDGTYTSTTLGTTGPRPPAFNGFEPDNNAPTFNGASSFVGVNGGLLSGRAAFSIGGWIRPTAAQAARTGLFGQNDAVEFGFISAGVIQVWTPNGAISSYTYPYPNGEWHHIAVVGENSTLSLYVDGTVRTTAAGSAGSSAFNFNIGGGGVFDATGNFFVGQIDEVFLHQRALSAAEVLSIYRAGTNAGGFSVLPYVATDVGPAMSNANATAYIRIPFTVAEPTNLSLLTLRIRYDDGFAAYINGHEVIRANAADPLLFNSAATGPHAAVSPVEFRFGTNGIVPGANLLAIQGLNATNNDGDFLIQAELIGTSLALPNPFPVYFTTPTPGADNGGGSAVPGPAIANVTHTPNVPLDNDDIVVTAVVTPTLYPVTNVVMHYRVMFDPEIQVTMFDTGGGLFRGTIPASASTSGQMVRYYIRAGDSHGNTNRFPTFLDPANSPQYLGTVINPGYVTSKLPIFHLFAAPGVLQTNPPTTQTGADSESGGRLAVFYDGEFYDNVYMELRGNTSAGQNKKSHRVEFNREHPFRHLPGYPRIRKTSFMAEFLDPTYLRQHLSFWLLGQMGEPVPFFYPVRAQINGSFYGLVFHNDVIGQEQVERMGYDPRGALYKAAGNILISRSSTGVFQKLEPDGPPDYTDYNQLCNGIVETAAVTNRRAAAFDMLDIPEVINYLAGARWNAENDDVWANMSLHRDTYGDQLWRIIPFDMNASWGQRYGGITPLDAIADSCKSHPLYGGSTIIACDGSSYNRIYDVIIALPETRQMLLRRQRTILDRWVFEQGVPPESRLLETHIRYMTNLIWTEAFLDRAKWGYSTWTASNKPLTNGVDELFTQFIALRRIHFSGTHCVTNTAKPIGITSASNAGIPLSQAPNASISISGVEFNPSTSNQLHEYVCVTNPNPFALDISGWKLGGGVNFTFKPGTVMPSNSVLYVSPDVLAFKARPTGPRGGMGLFVVGPYKGQLSARGEPLTITDDIGRLVYTNTYTGAPSLAQQFLRITELMYNPAPLAGNTNDAQEFEYVELKNISSSTTLDLNGVRFINGITFNFSGSAITSLGPGQRVLVVHNPAAFAARYGGGLPVAGQYADFLENNGERIQLVDGYGEEILDFSYNNSWYPITDGLGFSLTIVSENAEPDAWESKTNWRPSGVLYGAPGQSDSSLPYIAPILITEVLTHTDPPLRDTIELWNPTATNVNIGGWFLSDDFMTPKKYRIPNGTTISAGAYLTIDETAFGNGATALSPFFLDGQGDEAWLYSGDANTNLTGYAFGESFGAAASGVSFGRYTNSVGKIHFVAQATNTLGAPNSIPRVGPVVISEIMYHPPDFADGSDNSQDEFVELRNITASAVPLFNTNSPADTWRLRGGVDFDLPTGVTLAGGASLLLVNFAPSDTVVAGAFRTKYGLSPSLPIYGPYSGKLNNDHDDVKLERPDDPETNGVPYILIDRVEYEDANGWPTAADGTGSSLQRKVVSSYGNDPISWAGAAPSVGSDYVGGTAPVITVQPVSQTNLASLSATFSVTANGAAPLRYQWRLGGSILNGATNSMLVLNNVQPSQAGDYSVVVFNGAGSVVSSNATLTVNIPAVFFSQPASISLRGSTNAADYGNTTNNATFSAFAVGTGTVRYQWRFNSNVIAGATSTSFTVTNVQLTNDGFYDVLVTDDIGTIPSSPARLSVLLTPIIIQAPLSQTVPAGSQVNVSVAITGNPGPFGYQWRSNSLALAVVSSYSRTNFFTIPAVAVSSLVATNTYRLVITNAAHIAPGVTATFTITTVADSDHDGIPDSVETALGLNPNNPADAAGDLDNDGMSNLAEYLAGTDPMNPNSYLRVDLTSMPSMALIQLAAVSNRTYSVQYTDSLPNSGAWSKLADVLARSTNHMETIKDPLGTSNRFYRVVLPSQP